MKYKKPATTKQERLYEETMGREALMRQKGLADRCPNCLAAPGEQHSLGCKGWPGKVRQRRVELTGPDA